MPCHVKVNTLQFLTLNCISNVIKKLCDDKKILVYDLPDAVNYFLKIPYMLQSQICKILIDALKKELIPQKLNEKHHFIFVFMKSEELYMNDFSQSLLYLNELGRQDIQHFKKLSFRGAIFPFPESFAEESVKFRLYRPLYNIIRSLSNLTTFHGVRMCDDIMIELFAQYCPNLEEIDVELSYTVSDEGLCFLCGFTSSEEVLAVLKSGDRNPTFRGCKKLKKVSLDFTMASNLSVAALLQWCSNLEVLNVNPDINIGDVFSLVHGFDTINLNLVDRKHALTTLRSALEFEEDTLSLIVHTCPNLQDLTFRCYGIERKDKNLLAHLLQLPIRCLDLMNCNTVPLLWYLQQKGSSITKLVIEHLINAPHSVYLNRSHLQHIISFCPNITHFSLKMCGNVSILPNVPYSSFGDQLLYFTTLKELFIEGVTLEPDDIKILLSRCKNLEEVTLICQSLDILEDKLLYELLSAGALRNIRNFYAFRPMLTLAGLSKLLAECPLLKKVGPLSSWSIPLAVREQIIYDIREKNWDLNIETAETLQGYFF